MQCVGCLGLFFEVSSWYPKDWSCIGEATIPEELLEDDKLCRGPGSESILC